MHRSGSNSNTSGSRVVIRFAVVAFMAAAFTLLEGCSGSSSPNFHAPTTQSPTTGVTLQKIKITPSNTLIPLGASRQLFATGIYSDGSSVDITSQVTWGASSQPSTTNFVTVNSSGVAKATGFGPTLISASVGSISGLLQFFVTTNGFTPSTMAILQVPFKTSQIDVAYMPLQSKLHGVYAVQEVNLDADQFSSVLPVPLALKASIPMPAGFVPNAAAASPLTSNVAVISYTSPNIQIIDASNNPLDVNSNTLIATFIAPVKQSVTINGISCMICAAVVNPSNGQLVLSTAQGFYSMDMTAGTFTAMPFTPAPLPTANFSINPAVATPYILSTSPENGAVQILDLTTSAVTTYNNVTAAPAGVAIDLTTNFAAVVDGSVSEYALADLTVPQSPQFQANQMGLGVCSASAPVMNMVAGVTSNSANVNAIHTLLMSQTGGSCLGSEFWPTPGLPLNNQGITYVYSPIPATPDLNPFVNGNDPNAVATFTSVVDGKAYGVLVDGNQQWIAKINFGAISTLIGAMGQPPLLPSGALLPLSATNIPPDVIFLPTPITDLTLSLANIDFGTLSVGTLSPQVIVTATNIGAGTLFPQISISGANAGDFSYITNCSNTLLTQSNCPIYVTFTPTATGVRTAVLNVTSTGLNPQTVQLTGTGQ